MKQKNHSWQSFCTTCYLRKMHGWTEKKKKKKTGGWDLKRRRVRGQKVLGWDVWLEVWRQRGSHTELEKSLTEGYNSTLTMVVRWLEERFKQSCACNTDFYLSFMLERFERDNAPYLLTKAVDRNFKIKIQRCTMFLFTKIACIWTIF